MPSSSKPGGVWSALALLLMASILFAGRQFDGPMADFLAQRASLQVVDLAVQGHVLQLLMVPLGCLIVVLCRVTLGIRMLGPFRPILIAVAIHSAGFVLGTSCLLVVFVVVAAIRPRLEGGWLPFFGRLSVLLSVVVVLLVAAVMIGANLEYAPLEKLAFFPIIVLCLTADGFAKAMESEGLPSATVRAAATLGTALLINAVVGIEVIRESLFACPELVLAELALVILVSSRLRLGLLRSLNPPTKGSAKA